MNKRNVTILIFTHLIVCIVTFLLTMEFIGKQAADTMFKVGDMMKGGMLVNHYSLNVEIQNAFGGPKEQKEALLAYSEALDLAKKEAPENPLFAEKIYNTDKTLVYTRIAKIEKKAGNNESFLKFKAMALETCNKIPWNEKCNYEDLNEIATKFEKKSTFTTHKNES